MVVIAKAVANGTKLVFPADNHFYGDPSGRIEYPFGHLWATSTHIEDVSDKEMKKNLRIG